MVNRRDAHHLSFDDLRIDRTHYGEWIRHVLATQDCQTNTTG